MVRFKPPLIFVQGLLAGNLWDGTTPVGTPVFPDDLVVGRDRVIQWAPGNTGGRFNSTESYNAWKAARGDTDRFRPCPHVLEQATLLLGGQTDYELAATNGTDRLIVLAGTTETQRISSELRFVLETDWWFELTSVGVATSTHRASLIVMPWDQRTY